LIAITENRRPGLLGETDPGSKSEIGNQKSKIP
jgi:hypothetical protein